MSKTSKLCKHGLPKSKCRICKREYMRKYMKRYYHENIDYHMKLLESQRKRLTEKDKERFYRIQQDVRVLKQLRKKRGDNPNIDYSYLWK